MMIQGSQYFKFKDVHKELHNIQNKHNKIK